MWLGKIIKNYLMSVIESEILKECGEGLIVLREKEEREGTCGWPEHKYQADITIQEGEAENRRCHA